MTKREVLTKVIGAYIASGKGLPAVSNGRLTNDCWVRITEAICAAYPERDPKPVSRSTPPSPDVF